MSGATESFLVKSRYMRMVETTAFYDHNAVIAYAVFRCIVHNTFMTEVGH